MPAESPPRLTSIQWRVFALACGASFLLYVHRYSWNIIGHSLQHDFKFTNRQAGILFSLFYYTYFVAQIPSGVVIDRFGPHRFLSAIILAWSVTLAAIGWSASLMVIGASRLLFGAAQAGCYPALTKVTASWFEPSRRTVAQGWIATTAGRAGGAMAPIVLGTFLISTCGLSWERALSVLGLVGAVYAAVFWSAYRDPPRPSSSVDPDLAPPHSPATLPWGHAWRNGSLRFLTLEMFLDAGSDVAYVSLVGTYFLSARGFDIAKTGWLASLPLWGGAVGGIVGGWLNDRLIAQSSSRRWSRSGVGCTGKLVGGIFLALAVQQESGVAAACCLGAAKFFSDWGLPSLWGTCTDLGGRYSATVFSIVNTAGALAAIVMPPLYGELLDRFTTRTVSAGVAVSTTNWTPLFLLLAAMYLGCSACWLAVDCTRRIPQHDGASPHT
jgi:nitrate/nitrite transporter NarK